MAEAARPIDADNHYYEPRDFCTRHIEPRFEDRAVRVDEDERIWVGDRPFTFLANWSFDRTTKPGALRELLRNKRYERYDEDQPSHVEAIQPGRAAVSAAAVDARKVACGACAYAVQDLRAHPGIACTVADGFVHAVDVFAVGRAVVVVVEAVAAGGLRRAHGLARAGAVGAVDVAVAVVVDPVPTDLAAGRVLTRALVVVAVRQAVPIIVDPVDAILGNTGGVRATVANVSAVDQTVSIVVEVD